MRPTYQLDSFNPAFAGKVDYDADSIMFTYNIPELVQFITDINGRTPGNVYITFDSGTISLFPIFPDDDIEDCFFLIPQEIGLALLAWAVHEAYGLEGKELGDYVQLVFLQFAFAPTDSGGIILNNLSVAERRELYAAYQASIHMAGRGHREL